MVFETRTPCNFCLVVLSSSPFLVLVILLFGLALCAAAVAILPTLQGCSSTMEGIINQLSLRFRGLRVNVSTSTVEGQQVRQVAVEEVVGEDSVPVVEPVSEPEEVPRARGPGLCASTGPAVTGEPQVADVPDASWIAAQSRGLKEAGGFSAQGRILQAFLAGQAAANRLEGQQAAAVPQAHLKASVYVVLRRRGGQHDVPVWTRSHSEYKALVGNPVAQESISQGFASQAEAEAYVFGARLPPAQEV